MRHGIVEESLTSNHEHMEFSVEGQHVEARWHVALLGRVAPQNGEKSEALKPRLTLPLYYQWNMVTALDVVVKT